MRYAALMTTAPLSEADFDAHADRELQALVRSLERFDGEGLEVDLANGILTLEFDDGLKYVVNSHRAARQIWMAAEKSAWHFDYRAADARWIATKDGSELFET